MYRIIDKIDGYTDKYTYTFAQVKDFFKPSESDCQMDAGLLPEWQKVEDMVTLRQYLAMLGQNNYEVKLAEED